MPPIHNLIINELQGAVRLLVRGTAYELTEYHNVSQPEADIIALSTVVREVDMIADLPTLAMDAMIIAIRVSVENEHADALEKAAESKLEREHERLMRGKKKK